MPTVATHQRTRGPTGKHLATLVRVNEVEEQWERAKSRLTQCAKGRRKLGPWQALDGATAFASLIEQRLLTRISALEATVAELRDEPKRETATVAAPEAEGDRIELTLRGEVTRDVVDRLISKITAASPRDEICLRITSNGGDHPASLDLAEALLAHKGPVRCIAEGKCHSAAATIYMAADRDARVASHDAEFLIHAGSFTNMPAHWTADFARGHESADSDNLARWFSRRTGKSWFSFRRMMKTVEGETMDAARALTLGIVSDILPAPARPRRSSTKRKGKTT